MLRLSIAVSMVEKHYGGVALAGSFQGKGAMKMFCLRMAGNDGIFTVMVDADTGELLRLPGGKNHDHDE